MHQNEQKIPSESLADQLKRIRAIKLNTAILLTQINKADLSGAIATLDSKPCAVNLQDQQGNSALILTMKQYLASWNSNWLELAEKLLKQHADPGLSNNEQITAFQLYLTAREFSLFDMEKLNALFPAFVGNHTEASIKSSAALATLIKGELNLTPTWAVKTLLENKADIFDTDSRGENAIEAAKKLGSRKILSLLFEHITAKTFEALKTIEEVMTPKRTP